MLLLSHFSHVQLFVALWAAAHQAPLSMGSSRREHWSGLPCPPSGDLPEPCLDLLHWQVDSATGAPWEAPEVPYVPAVDSVWPESM